MRFLDIVEDVTDVVEAAVAKYGDVVPATAKLNAYIEDKWWAVPFRSESGGWFARKDIFEAKGIDVTTLETLDQRRDAALAVSDPSKEIWGWGLTINRSGDGHGLITNVIQNFGGRFVDETGTKVTFNSPETVAAVTWLQETYTSEKYKPMLPPGIESWTDPSNNEAFLAGKVALTSNAYTVYGKAKLDKNPIFPNIHVLRPPMTNDGSQRLESGSSGWLTIFKGSQNIDLAKELIVDLLNPTNFLPMVKGGGGLFLPAYKNLWTDEVLAVDPNFPTLKEIMFNDTAYTGQAYPAKPNPAIAGIDAQSVLSQMMTNVTTGQMTPEEAVQDAHDKIVQIFEELGLPQS
jgi:multiple sugar transport system substrate-binding protein